MGEGVEMLVGIVAIPQPKDKPIQENHFNVSYDWNLSEKEHLCKRDQWSIEPAAALSSAGSFGDWGDCTDLKNDKGELIGFGSKIPAELLVFIYYCVNNFKKH